MTRHLITLAVLGFLVSTFGGNANADGLDADPNHLTVAEALADMQGLEGPSLGEPLLGDCEDEEMVDLYLEANRSYQQQIEDLIAQVEVWLP